MQELAVRDVVARSHRSIDAAVEAYLCSLRRIHASETLLAAPIWTAQRPAKWQVRQADGGIQEPELA